MGGTTQDASAKNRKLQLQFTKAIIHTQLTELDNNSLMTRNLCGEMQIKYVNNNIWIVHFFAEFSQRHILLGAIL